MSLGWWQQQGEVAERRKKTVQQLLFLVRWGKQTLGLTPTGQWDRSGPGRVAGGISTR